MTQFTGKMVRTSNELSRAAERFKRGEVAETTVIRDGMPIQLFIKF